MASSSTPSIRTSRLTRAHGRPTQQRYLFVTVAIALKHIAEEANKHSIDTEKIHLHAARGFYGATMPELATRAGVGTGTIYRYFDSKELLVNVVYRWQKRLLMTRLSQGLGVGEPRAVFGALWRQLADFARDDPTAFAFLELHHHADYLDATSRQLEEDWLLPLVQLTEATSAAGITKPLPAPALIATVWGAIVGLFKAQRLGHLELTDELIASTEHAVWDALRRNK